MFKRKIKKKQEKVPFKAKHRIRMLTERTKGINLLRFT